MRMQTSRPFLAWLASRRCSRASLTLNCGRFGVAARVVILTFSASACWLSHQGWAAGGTNTAASVIDNNLSASSSYDTGINPTNSATVDIQFPAGGTYATPTFDTNGSALVYGTLNDFNTTAFTVTNSSATASTITLSTASNSLTGPALTDLLYVGTGANLTISPTAGAGGLSLALGVSGNFDIVGTAAIGASITGTGLNLTKMGTGTLTLSGNNTYLGTTVVGVSGTATGMINLVAGGVINGGALTVNGGTAALGNQFQVNGGTLTATGNSVVNSTSGSVGAEFLLNSGSATFATIQTASTQDNSLIRVAGGTFAATDLQVRRSANYTTATATVSANNGFNVAGGIATLGTIEVGTANAGGGMRVDGGAVTVSGAVTLGNNSSAATRYNILQVNGGSFTSTDTVSGIVLGKTGGTVAAPVTSQYGSFNVTGTGVATVEKVSFGFDNTVTAGFEVLTLGGGTLYVGSGGLVRNSTGGTATVSLNTGTLGAKADWSSSMPMALGTTSATGLTIQAADAGGTAHNITLGGVLSGASGGFTKTGGGILTLTATNTYTGATTVNAGTLAGTGTVAGTVAVNTGGTLLAGSPTAVGNLTTGAVTLNAGSTFSAVVAGDASFSQLLATTTSAAGAFSITLLGTPTFAGTGEALTLIPSGFSGTFTNGSFTVGGYIFTADYLTTPGGFAVDVTASAAVPEPSTWVFVLMCGAAGAMVFFRRARKSRI